MAGAGTTPTALLLHNCSQSFQIFPSLQNTFKMGICYF